MEGLYRCVSQASGERKTRNYRASEGKTPLQNMLMCVCVDVCVDAYRNAMYGAGCASGIFYESCDG